MESQLTPEDLPCLLHEVSRFSSRSVAPVYERPETLASVDQLDALMQEAKTNGFLNSVEETGISLWENASDPIILQFSCQALYEIARQNPGLAYLFHHASLSYYLVKQLGFKLKAGDIPVCTIQGHYGLARHSLARYFKQDLEQADVAILKDYFCPQSNQFSVLHGRQDWTHLISPIIVRKKDNHHVIQFSMNARDKLFVEPLENGHGLNECSSFFWRKEPGGRAVKTSTLLLDQSKRLLSNMLQMQWLGLISIARGTTEKGYDLAKEYASMRVQGGKAIENHPAVQQMLSQAKIAVSCSKSLVDNICVKPLSTETLVNVAEARSQLHPLLCQGANNVMQVFGGMGYMQDAGLEKIVRDNAQLKLMNGTPTELMLFLAELERVE